MITTACNGVKHCGNIRTCQRCARLRQRDIANAAEALERQHGQLTLTRLSPENNTQEEIRRLRASFIRRAVAPAGIWTIETGEMFGGLHINILSPKPAPARWRNCSDYSELVRCTSREAAAYISKQSGMPPLEQYAGNLYGSFGQLFTYLTSNAAPAPVQAAAIEVTMNGGKFPMCPPKYTNEDRDWSRFDQSKPPNFDPYNLKECNPPLIEKITTQEEKAEIMRRHLPNLRAAINPASAYQLSNPTGAHKRPVLAPETHCTPGAWPEGKE